MPTQTLKTSVLDRFLRYVTYDTQSEEGTGSVPSTAKQLVLLDLLVEELKAIGIKDAARDAHGIVMATIPSTSKKANVPVVGFLAHVDTSPELSGASVKPIVHRDYRGQDLTLPDDPTAVLRASEFPDLLECVGHDIVTASGTTLLGADNKTGVAEIVAAAEYLMQHPEIAHGPVRIAFTPDEEIGHGATHFDVKRFGAVAAYTMDGEGQAWLEMETFSADSMWVTFDGNNTHPGYAKGKMVNAVKAAADFVARLPRDVSPEATEDAQGFVHPYVVEGGVDQTKVKLLIRDFSTPGLAEKERMVEMHAKAAAAAWPGMRVSFQVEESYRNMREVLDRHPKVGDYAREAYRRAGLTPREKSVRGGTDGARLCFMGLPTPNLFSGQHNFHSRLEWTTAQEMEKAVEVIVELARVWEEKG